MSTFSTYLEHHANGGLYALSVLDQCRSSVAGVGGDSHDIALVLSSVAEVISLRLLSLYY